VYRLSFSCTHCGKSLKTLVEKPSAPTQPVACPKCGKKFVPQNVKITPAASPPGVPSEAQQRAPKTQAALLPGTVWAVVGVGAGTVATLILMILLTFGSSRRGINKHADQEHQTGATAKSGSDAPAPPKPPTPVAPKEPPRPVEAESPAKAMASVVFVETDTGFGSGFIVQDPSFVATNLHVVEGAKTIKASFPDGSKTSINGFYAFSEGHDLVVLRLASPARARPLKLHSGEVSQGSEVWALGAPRGLRGTMTKGIVSSCLRWRDIPENVRPDAWREQDSLWIQTDAAVSGGNSGGPLITRTGEVLAVNTIASVSPKIQNVNFSIHCKHLASLLATLPKKPISLEQLPKPSASSGQVHRAAEGDQAELDWQAWEAYRQAVGRFYVQYIIRKLAMELSERLRSTAWAHSLRAEDKGLTLTHFRRAFVLDVAKESLVAAEQIGRFPLDALTPALGEFLNTQCTGFLKLHEASRGLIAAAPAPEAPEGMQLQKLWDHLQGHVMSQQTALIRRLTFQHNQTFFDGYTLKDDDLEDIFSGLEDLENIAVIANNSLDSANTSPRTKGGELAQALDRFAAWKKRWCEVLWSTYRTSDGHADIALAYIIRLAPGTKDAIEAGDILAARKK
jgi:S1-C subfamily serine protease